VSEEMFFTQSGKAAAIDEVSARSKQAAFAGDEAGFKSGNCREKSCRINELYH
jgi:hypothetical protein